MNLPRTKLFTGSAMGPSEPPMQYVRLKKEGIGMWIKGQVTETFPPDTEKLPWGITLTPDGTSYKGTVWPGTVAGILPSNLFSNGVLAEFSVGASLMKWKAKCLTNGKQITSVQIVVDATDPPAQVLVPSALPAEAWFVFGLTFEGSSYRTLGPNNPTVLYSQVIITDKTTAPPPGIPGVDRWYQIIFQ